MAHTTRRFSSPLTLTGEPKRCKARRRQGGRGRMALRCRQLPRLRTPRAAGCLGLSFRLWKEGDSCKGVLLEHPFRTHRLPLFGCDFSLGSWDSQTLSTPEFCGFALFYFGVGEGVRGGGREGAGL